jgi:hypothetical protein
VGGILETRKSTNLAIAVVLKTLCVAKSEQSQVKFSIISNSKIRQNPKEEF